MNRSIERRSAVALRNALDNHTRNSQYIDEIHEAFLRTIKAANYWMSADERIGEQHAEAVLGWARGSLKNLRCAGEAPPRYQLGGGRNRVTYRVRELAEWVVAHRETN
jgi:hypothetical protein